LEEFPVDAGIFPAGVVNQTVVKDEVKKLLLQSGYHARITISCSPGIRFSG
jgi:hypothetical protein